MDAPGSVQNRVLIRVVARPGGHQGPDQGRLPRTGAPGEEDGLSANRHHAGMDEDIRLGVAGNEEL